LCNLQISEQQLKLNSFNTATTAPMLNNKFFILFLLYTYLVLRFLDFFVISELCFFEDEDEGEDDEDK